MTNRALRVYRFGTSLEANSLLEAARNDLEAEP
jgi:hypothetical protein